MSNLLLEVAMLPLVEFPEIVEHYAPSFGEVFSAQAMVQFKRYITGLIVSENKTIEGMNRLFVNESRDQSSLNRLLTESPYSLSALNAARLELLNHVPGTQLKPRGVLSIDDTLLTHYGQHFAGIALLFDHSEQSYVWAHNLVTLHYSDDLTDYPVLFQLWKPADLERIEQGLLAAGVELKASKQALKARDPRKWRQYLLGVWKRHADQPKVAALYDSKLEIAKHFLTEWRQLYPQLDLPVVFDDWYTQPAFCAHLDETLQLGYVGTLSGDNDKVLLQDGEMTLNAFAQRLKQAHLQAIASTGQSTEKPKFQPVTIQYKGHTEQYYSYCNTHRIRTFTKKQRLVINYRQADLSDQPVFYISNRLYWHAHGITRIRRHRWPVEVYHEEGKAEGLDQYQLRDFRAIERHIALVAVAYSLLRAAQHDTVLLHKLQRQLELELEGSAAFWRRCTQAQCLWSLALFIATGVSQGQSLHTIMTPLLRTLTAA
jgi:hypothetical protein